MQITDEMRSTIRRWHANTCFPEAYDHEIDVRFSALAPLIMEECAKVCDAAAMRWEVDAPEGSNAAEALADDIRSLATQS